MAQMRRIGRFAAIAALGTVLLAMSPACAIHTAPFVDGDGDRIAGSVATMIDAPIGGIEQRLWFRGMDVANPAVILLHGGPGASEAALFRHFNGDLERDFLMVYWEQRGAGRSYRGAIPPESMTIEQFVRDLDEVVELVRQRFDKQRVVLLGHSWGSAIGVLYAARHPEKVAAYVGVGQVADMREGERLSYEFALAQAERRGDRGALRALRKIGPPPHTVDEMLTSRRWVERFGGSFHADLSTGSLIWAALRTDEANLIDLIKFGQGNRFSLNHLWNELRALDLDDTVTRLGVPVVCMLGRHDWQVPAVVAARYCERIEAPWKRIVWFERSAHHPPFEEPELFNRTLVEHLKPLTGPGPSSGDASD
jgi:pimeloyl-ACP methyl ester carboxylesterase